MRPLTLPIVVGRQQARKLGFRTLNFDISKQQPSVEHGIYAGWVEIDGVCHRAAIHYGPRPFLDDTKPTLEAHLIDIELAEPPTGAVIELVHYLRAITDFATAEALVDQIGRDVDQVRTTLGGDR